MGCSLFVVFMDKIYKELRCADKVVLGFYTMYSLPDRKVIINMLYFRFSADTKSFSQMKEEFSNFKFAFFNQLHRTFGLDVCGMNNTLYDVLDVPIDSFNIDDELVDGFGQVITKILYLCSHLPIDQFGGKSLSDFGSHIEFCKKISNHEVNLMLEQYMQFNDFKVFTEEVMWRNMTNQDKVAKFSKYFQKIDTNDKELVVIDPYIFSCLPTSSDYIDYCDLLSSILGIANAKSIIFITDRLKYNAECAKKVLTNINKSKIHFSKNFHDRFWIADRKAGFAQEPL